MYIHKDVLYGYILHAHMSMCMCKNPTHGHLGTQKAQVGKNLNESWWGEEKGSKRSMNRTPYRERNEKEERKKGVCESVMNEEKKKPEQRGRQ